MASYAQVMSMTFSSLLRLMQRERGGIVRRMIGGVLEIFKLREGSSMREKSIALLPSNGQSILFDESIII